MSAGLAIYDTMQYISCPVHTFGMGMAASMGSLLLAGGEKGKRYALKNSTVMIHRKSDLFWRRSAQAELVRWTCTIRE